MLNADSKGSPADIMNITNRDQVNTGKPLTAMVNDGVSAITDELHIFAGK